MAGRGSAAGGTSSASTDNVLAAVPKSAHQGAKAALAEICNAEDKDHALAAAQAFAADHGAKWPKAVAKIIDDSGRRSRVRAHAAIV